MLQMTVIGLKHSMNYQFQSDNLQKINNRKKHSFGDILRKFDLMQIEHS